MSSCLSSEQIERYAKKQLSPAERDLADLHLETCDRCVEALLEIELAGSSNAPGTANTPTADTSPGPRIGPYICLRELGRGGQGHVYLAQDTRLGRRVALKVLSPHLAPSPEIRLRFQREAAALSRLDHPGICTVYEVGEADGTAYIAMRHVEGETLARRIASEAAERQQGRSATREDVLRQVLLVERVARALHAAHEAGLVHRDVKPGNIMVSRGGEPVLLDFGLVREETSRHTLTRTGELMGTPAYMSPEQVRGDHALVDRRSDVYSLGVALHEALTLKLPFEAPTVPALYRQILTESAPDPRRHNRHITEDLKAILETAMEPDRARRYQTALDFAEDLRRFRAGETVLARPAGPIVKLRRWTMRNRTATIAGLVVVLSLSIALGLTMTFLRRAERDRDDKAVALEREEAVRLALHSATILPTNPGQALLLAVESVERRPTAVGSSALISALDGCHERRRFFGHKSEVQDVDLSPDGRLAVTASLGGSARLWSTETGASLRVLEGHQRPVVGARFSPDGTRVLTAGYDATARLWDVASGKELLVLRGHEHGLRLAIFSPDGARVLTVGRNTARVWDAATGEALRLLHGGTDDVTCAAFSPEGTRVVTGEGDFTAIVWDAQTGARSATLKGHTEGIYEVKFSADGLRVVTAGNDGTARVWDAQSGEQQLLLEGHKHGLYSAAFSPDGQRIATGSEDFAVRLWDAATGKVLRVIADHGHKIPHVEFSRDGSRLLTFSYDRTARVWDGKTGEAVAVLRGHSAPLSSARFSPDGTQVITGAYDYTARLWDVVPRGKLLAIREPGIAKQLLRLSPDGKLLVVATGESEAVVWSVETAQRTARLTGHTDTVLQLEISPDSSRILTASRDGTARLWDPASGRELHALAGHTSAVATAVFSPGGDRVITGSTDKTARLWDAASGAAILVLEGHEAPVHAVASSLDGRLAATGSLQWDRSPLESRDGSAASRPRSLLGSGARRRVERRWCFLLTREDNSVALWEVASRRKRAAFNPGARARGAAFSPDGKLAHVISESTRVQVLDTATGEVVASLVHSDRGFCAAWSTDGKLLATGAEDAKLRLWSTASWEKVLESEQEHAVGHVQLGGDGRSVLTLDRDTARWWPLDPLPQAKRLLPGSLTPDERDRFEVGSREERAARRQAWQGGEIFGAGAR